MSKLAKQVASWNSAIEIIDQSEAIMRDVIERDLSHVAALPHVKYSDAMKVADIVMKKITKLRTSAIKKAFRHLKGNL